MGDHVWLMTSRQTDPDLTRSPRFQPNLPMPFRVRLGEVGFHLQLVDVGVEDAINKANTRRLIGVLVGKLDVNLPGAALERSCPGRQLSCFCPTRAIANALSAGPLKRT